MNLHFMEDSCIAEVVDAKTFKTKCPKAVTGCWS